MDFNLLYHRRGVSLMRADAAACAPSRAAHLGLAAGYGRRIAAAMLSPPASPARLVGIGR